MKTKWTRIFALIAALATTLTLGIGCKNSSSDEDITYYTVTFDSNGGSSVDTQTVQRGKMAVEPRSPTRNGYTFDGWYDGNTKFSFYTYIYEDIRLTAKWTYIGDDMPSNEDDGYTTYYTVTFDPNGGTFIDSQSVASGMTAVKPEDPTHYEYTFDGWYDGDTLFDFSTPITNNITLTAHWTYPTNSEDTPTSEDDNTTICKIYPKDIYNTDFERGYGLFYTIRLLGAWKHEEMKALNEELRAISKKNIDRYITLDLTQMTGTTIIGDSAFYDCDLLVSVKIGGGVTEIGGSAFYSCGSIESITIGNRVTSIGGYAFRNCKTDTITFTGTLQQWNNIAKDYYWNYYNDIRTVICSDYILTL